MDNSVVTATGGNKAVASTQLILVRNTEISCGSGVDCTDTAVLAGCGDTVAYGRTCASNADCAATSDGLRCLCPPTWLGNPLVEEVRKPTSFSFLLSLSLSLPLSLSLSLSCLCL
jgi:hypothetical protein